MKKRNIILAVFVIVILSYSIVSYACTSFVVFSDNNLYGMNFDYPETEIRLMLHKVKDKKIVSMEFKEGNEFIPFAGMNNKGLFVAVQMLYPSKQGKASLENNEIYIGELGALIGKYERVQQIEEYIEDKKLVNMPVTIHQLFADKYGDAMTVEVGDDENQVVKIKDKSMVMTNFPNSSFIDKDYKEVRGTGADRYKAAYEYIEESIDEFNLESGWEVLKRTVQSSSGYPTQCSMIFDPENGDVYISLKRNFDKLWKISLEKETIEGVEGFEEPVEIKIKHDGILVSELLSATINADIPSSKTDKEIKTSNNNLYLILGLGCIVLIFILSRVVQKNRKSHSK